MSVNYSGNSFLVNRLVFKSINFLRFHENVYFNHACGVRTVFNGYLHGLGRAFRNSDFSSKYCIYRISDMGNGCFVIVFGYYFDFIRVDLGNTNLRLSGSRGCGVESASDCIYYDGLVDCFNRRWGQRVVLG